jgi:Ca2+-binding RTX toxin-like protein
MASRFIVDQGRAEVDWETLLFGSNGDPGLFSQTAVISGKNGSNKSSVKIKFGDTVLKLKSSDGDLKVVDGKLKGGTVTGIDLLSSGDKVFHLTGLSLEAATVRSLLKNGADQGRDTHFLNVFASTGTTFEGPDTGPVTFFGSSKADIFNFTAAANPDDINYVWTGGGADVVHGSSGFDFVDYSAATRGLTIDFAEGTVVDKDGKSYGTFDRKIEAVGGSDFKDTITGNGKHNVIFGNGGKDDLSGKGGDDYFSAGRGNDSIGGGGGWDTLGFERDGDATQGIDLKYDAGSAFSGTLTDDYGDSDVFASIEHILGSYLADRMEGNDAANNLEGRGGVDTVIGGGGNDTVRGDAGDDVVTGGAGNDQFVLNVEDNGVDTFTDFVSGADSIRLVYADIPAGSLTAAQFLAQAGAEIAETAEQVLIYDTTTGNLFYDHDGVGGDGSVLLAMLAGHPTLTFADFEIA